MAKKNTAVNMNVLNLESTKLAVLQSIKSDQPIGIEGPPGVGKSAIVEWASNETGLRFEPLLLSQCDPTDVGGFPVVVDGRLLRLPLGPIKMAAQEPTLLFLDELTMAAPPVQGAAMRLVYERWAGDVKLHPKSRIVMAMNPPEQAAGGYELALPLVGRMTKIVMLPEAGEIREYLFRLGRVEQLQAELEGATGEARSKLAEQLKRETSIRRLATDIAATTMVAPDLLQIEPPPGTQQAGTPWGAPRSWERAIRCLAELLDDTGTVIGGGSKDSAATNVFNALLSGNVGDEQAASYMAIRKIRDQLPSIPEITKDPQKAKTPKSMDVAIAALGVTAQVAMTHANSAWVYAERLPDEARAAAISVMGRYPLKKADPWFEEAKVAQRKLISQIGEAVLSSYNK